MAAGTHRKPAGATVGRKQGPQKAYVRVLKIRDVLPAKWLCKIFIKKYSVNQFLDFIIPSCRMIEQSQTKKESRRRGYSPVKGAEKCEICEEWRKLAGIFDEIAVLYSCSTNTIMVIQIDDA